MTGILIRRGENIQRHKRQRSGEDGGRDGSELTIRQKKKKNANDCWEPSETRKRQGKIFPRTFKKENAPA